MDYRLVTYQCLHFVVIAQHDYNLDEPDDSSDEGLFMKPTSTQRHSASNCGATECQSISREEWAARVHAAILSCQQYFSSAVHQYYHAAFQYHSIAPTVRAATVSNSLCEPAHQQFGIKNCAWVEDAFFEEWQSSSDTLRDLEGEDFAELDDDGRAEVVAVLNATRATLSGVQGRITSLVQGVEIIQGHQQQQQQVQSAWHSEQEKAGAKRGASGRKRDTRALCFLVAPMQVFNRAVYKVWERRVWGLWEAFHLD